MMQIRNFVTDIVRSGKRYNKIEKMVDSVYGDKFITKSQIFNILKQIKDGKYTGNQRSFIVRKQRGTHLLSPLSPPILYKTDRFVF